jgi:hypothetical protein
MGRIATAWTLRDINGNVGEGRRLPVSSEGFGTSALPYAFF